MARLGTSSVVVVFIVFLPLAFSEELAQGLYEMLSSVDSGPTKLRPWWALPALDAWLLLVFLIVARRQWRRSDSAPGRSVVLWWATGALLTLALDVGLDVVARSRYTKMPQVSMWIDIAAAFAYVIFSAMLLAATFRVSPIRMLTPTGRGMERESESWRAIRGALPLLLGTLGAYIAGAIWESYLECPGGSYYSSCGGSINTQFFAQVSQIIPVLLVAVGLQSAALYRKDVKGPDYGTVIFAVVVLVIGEMLAITALTPAEGDTRGVELTRWHEYFAFIVSVEAVFVGAATLIWAIALYAQMALNEQQSTSVGRSDDSTPSADSAVTRLHVSQEQSDSKSDAKWLVLAASLWIAAVIMDIARTVMRRHIR